MLRAMHHFFRISSRMVRGSVCAIVLLAAISVGANIAHAAKNSTPAEVDLAHAALPQPKTQTIAIAGPSSNDSTSAPTTTTQNGDVPVSSGIGVPTDSHSYWAPLAVITALNLMGIAAVAYVGWRIFREYSRRTDAQQISDVRALTEKLDVIVANQQDLKTNLESQWTYIQSLVPLDKLKGAGQHLALVLQTLQLVEKMLDDTGIQKELGRARETLFNFLQTAISLEKSAARQTATEPRELAFKKSAAVTSTASDQYKISQDGAAVPALQARFVDEEGKRWAETRDDLLEAYAKCSLPTPATNNEPSSSSEAVYLLGIELTGITREQLIERYDNGNVGGALPAINNFWQSLKTLLSGKETCSKDMDSLVVWTNNQSPEVFELPSIQFQTMTIRGLRIRRLKKPRMLNWKEELSQSVPEVSTLDNTWKMLFAQMDSRLGVLREQKEVELAITDVAKQWCAAVLQLRAEALRSQAVRKILSPTEVGRWEPLLIHAKAVAAERGFAMALDPQSVAAAISDGTAGTVEWLMSEPEKAEPVWLMPRIEGDSKIESWILVPTAPRKAWQRALVLAAESFEKRGQREKMAPVIERARKAMQSFEQLPKGMTPEVQKRVIDDFWQGLWNNVDPGEHGNRCRSELRSAVSNNLEWQSYELNQNMNEHFIPAPSSVAHVSRPVLMNGDMCLLKGWVAAQRGDSSAPASEPAASVVEKASEQSVTLTNPASTQKSSMSASQDPKCIAQELDKLIGRFLESEIKYFSDTVAGIDPGNPGEQIKNLRSCFKHKWEIAHGKAAATGQVKAWLSNLNSVLQTIDYKLDLNFELRDVGGYYLELKSGIERPALIDIRNNESVLMGNISKN